MAFTVTPIEQGRAAAGIDARSGLEAGAVRRQRAVRPTFQQVLKSEAERSRAELGQKIIESAVSFAEQWKSSQQRVDKLQGRLPADFSALFELQRATQRIQLTTHLAASGCDTVAQTVKRLQQSGG